MIYLKRFCDSKMGVFGKLHVGDFSCYTVERPWLNNEPYSSCIPTGVYDVKLGMYNRGGYPAFEIMNVPNRTHIKIHKGNTMNNVVGCIAVGNDIGCVSGKWAVLNSDKTYTRFMDALEGITETKITIE